MYSNAVARRNIPARENFEFFHKTEELPNTNLDINAVAYTGQIRLLNGQDSQLLLTLAILLLVYILLIILAVQHLNYSFRIHPLDE